MATELWAIGLVVLGTFVGAFGALYFKFGANKLRFELLALLKNWELMLGVLFYIVGSVFFIIGLKGGEVSVLYPFTSLTYVWVVFLSIKLLKERMNSYKWLGILSIFMGVSLIGVGS